MARELGIRATLLTRWKREAQTPGTAAFGGSGTPPGRGAGSTQARVGAGEEGTGFFREAATFFAKGSP
ncbi:transposase (fragment) [Xanthomonas citri pv. bilvae]